MSKKNRPRSIGKAVPVSMILMAALANGCATNYSCGQYPESGCQPVSEVYRKTNDGFHDYRKNLYDKKKSNENRNLNIKISNKAIATTSPGDPILTKPVIMRVLFNSWQDSEKDLNAGGYVYIRLSDSQWVTERND